MKRRNSSLLVAVILVFALSICAWATGTADSLVVNQPGFVPEYTVTVSHVNPEYEALGVKFEKPSADCMTFAETTVNSLEEASVYLREQMENRVTEVTIVVNNHAYVSNEQISADWKTILYGAFEHTGVSTQGDYIMRHYGRSTGGISHDGVSTATFTYTITYDTTLEQENIVGDRIDELYAQWDEECGFYDLSDYEQVKIIFDYICENVAYDYDNLNDTTYTLKFSAYAALINKSAVCQGYANLFYRMTLELGIDSRIVVGWSRGSSTKLPDHGWNIVRLGDYYYYLDATWGDAVTTINYDWFLIGSENFGHTSDFANEASFVGTDEYPVDAKDYVPAASFGVTPSVDPDSGKPVLTWDVVEGAEKYEVWRSTSKDGTYYLMSTLSGTRYVNTIAEAGKTYYYKVRTVSGENYGEFSAVKEITCICARPVISIWTDAATGYPTLSWTAVSGAAKYEVWRATSKDGTYYKMYTFSGTKYSNTTAVPGQTYYYKVVAVSANGVEGNSQPSTVKSITCDCARPVVTASLSESGLPVLTWNAVTGATKYEIWRATSENGTYYKMYTQSGTKYTNTTAVSGQTYYYKVIAVCGKSSYGNSAYSSVVSVTCGAPAPTISIWTDAATGYPTLSWDAVAGATKYEIWRATSKDGTYYKMYTFNGTKYSNTTAVPGQTYYYKVRAVTETGYSNFSSVKSITCDCARPVTKISIDAASGKPVLTWDLVTGATTYEVWRATSADGTYYKMDTVKGTRYIDTSAVPGETYYYKIMAICDKSSYGNSAFSSYKYYTCDCARPVVTATVDSKGRPYLTWDAVDGATKYEIWRATSENGTYYKMYTVSGTSYTNTTAESGKTYYYKVIALCGKNVYGNSAYSEIVSVVVP